MDTYLTTFQYFLQMKFLIEMSQMNKAMYGIFYGFVSIWKLNGHLVLKKNVAECKSKF